MSEIQAMKQNNSVLQNNSIPAFVRYVFARQLTPGENSRILLAHHIIYASMSLDENHIALTSFSKTKPTNQEWIQPSMRLSQDGSRLASR